MSLAAFLERSAHEREDWRYTDLAALLAKRVPAALGSGLRPNAAASADQPRLVFVNGAFAASQSRFGSVPSCILMGDAGAGYKLTLGPQTCLVAQPIEMIFTATPDAPAEINVRLSVDIGANGRLSLIERHAPSPAVTTVETDIVLQERAKFMHGKIVSGGAHIAAASVAAASGSYYGNFCLIRGAAPVRNEIDVLLRGAEAQAVLSGAMLLRGAEHADIAARVTHLAQHCSSRQIYKTVLDGAARGVFQGKIVVAPGAQKTDGRQISRALLLSDRAEMDAKPELEINADDVKCSHGCAVGALDEDAMFYLRARGLDEAQARALLIDAFVAEAFDEIRIEGWREAFRAEMEGWNE